MSVRPEIIMLVVALMVTTVSETHAQSGLGDMFRSMSGALRGKERQTQKQENTAPVMGIRGIDEPDQAKAKRTSGNEDYLLMVGWTATRPEVKTFALEKHLVARPVTFKKGKSPTSSLPNSK